MQSFHLRLLGSLFFLPGMALAQGKLNVNGAVINVANGAYLTTYDVNMSGTSLLTVTNATLNVGDNIVSSSNINLRYGALGLFGNNGQTTPAGPFVNNAVNDLIVSNYSAAGVSFGGPVDIYNSLTYSDVGMKVSTNDNLTFKSLASNTAWLGDMTGNTIVGQATVERYISNRKAWRFLSVPTNSAQTIRQTWQEGAASSAANPVPGYGTQVIGPAGTAAGFDATSINPAIETYNSATGTWTGVSGTGTGIKTTTGYMIFIRGDRTVTSPFAAPTSTVLRTKGNLYTGNQAAITVNAGQFVGIGNPYPAAIDMRNITKSGVKDFFYVWDPALSSTNGYGGYQTFSNNGSGNYVITPGGGSYASSGSISNYIASGMAFLVQGSVGGGTLTFREGAKTTGSGVTSTPAGIPTPALTGNLYGLNADSSTYLADGFLVNYGDTYSNKVDDEDAIKRINSAENISTKTAGNLLVVERRQTISGQDTIFLNMTGVSRRNYRFEFDADNLNQPGLNGFLVDNYLHTQTPLTMGGTTQSEFAVTGVAGSYAANRFMIVFNQSGTLPVTFTSITAVPANQNIDVSWNVADEMNIQQYVILKSLDGTNFQPIAETAPAGNGGRNESYTVIDKHRAEGYNYYRIQSVDINGKTATSNVVKVLIGSLVQSFTVSPNPVINKTIYLQLNNQPAGNYSIRLLNKEGQVVFQTEIEHVAGSSIEKIQPGRYLPAGIYQLEIIQSGGRTSSISVVY